MATRDICDAGWSMIGGRWMIISFLGLYQITFQIFCCYRLWLIGIANGNGIGIGIGIEIGIDQHVSKWNSQYNNQLNLLARYDVNSVLRDFNQWKIPMKNNGKLQFE